jgi:hypothetical protein
MFNMGRRSIVYLVTCLDNYNFSLHIPRLWLLLLLASFDKVQSAEDLFHPLKRDVFRFRQVEEDRYLMRKTCQLALPRDVYRRGNKQLTPAAALRPKSNQ